MVIIQFYNAPKNLPCNILKTFKYNTYLLDCSLQNYDIMLEITSNNRIITTSDAHINVLSTDNTETSTYTVLQSNQRLDGVIDALDDILDTNPTVICIPWQIPRNYILDFRIQQLLDKGFTVVCSVGNNSLPVLDVSPAAVDGVIKVGGNDTTGKLNWYDCYDYIVESCDDSNDAAHVIAQKLYSKESINVDLKLDFYSDPTVRSAPWAKRVVTDKISERKMYEFFPVANLRYVAGEQIVPIKPGDTVSYLYGNVELYNFSNPEHIECTAKLPRGITFDITNGWLYGTFKYKQNMFHRLQVDVNGQYFELHFISCDYDNKPTYEECKEKYFNREYDAPPFSLREYWMPMSKPVKLLEPGDPWIRTYNLNDLHLYRKNI